MEVASAGGPAGSERLRRGTRCEPVGGSVAGRALLEARRRVAGVTSLEWGKVLEPCFWPELE